MMTDDGDQLGVRPADPYATGLAMIEHHGLILLQGPQDLVDRFVAGDPALDRRIEVEASGSAVSGALAALAALTTTMGSGGGQTLFRLDEVGMSMFESGTLAGSGGGFLRLFGKGPNGAITGHGAMQAVDFSPQQLLNAQMALTTLALTAAIQEVQAAVERVEAKVDLLRDLLEADRVGAVIGAHRSLSRHAADVDFDGVLTDTDWHSIDDIGIQVEQQIEAIRAFVFKRLKAAEDEGGGIDERRDALDDVRELSESLDLLLVAQNSLFVFQQLRLSRIRTVEPARLERALAGAQLLLDGHTTEDAHMLARTREIVAQRVSVKALEIHRFMNARALVSAAGEVDEMLARFAGQRALPYEPIVVPPIPGIDDAVQELRERGGELASGTKRFVGQLTSNVRSTKGESQLESGEVAPKLTDGREADLGPATSDPDGQDQLDSTRLGRFKTGLGDRLGRRGRQGPSSDADEVDPMTSRGES